MDYCCISRFFPEDWEDVIKQEPAVISPLHDKDVTEDGERKKPHYHVILSYKGNKSFEQIDEIARLLHASYSLKE